ncbi:MAG: peptidylprolyl isomerase [Sulfurimonas sp.]
MKKVFFTLLFLLTFTALYAQNPHVVLQTNQGDIELELYPDVAPLAVENFTTHVKNGYYNNLTFHRIIKDFMIQGGDPTGTGRGGESIWGKAFKNEYKANVVFDKAGILAMANAGPNTNGSQFFITVAPAPWLNGGYTIFGKVADQASMDVVMKLSNVKTNGRYGGNKPLQTQIIKKAYLK